MKGLFIQKRAIFKVMAIMVGLVLTACGSGGGGDDFNFDNPPPDICNQSPAERTETKPIGIDEVSIVSKDGRAIITVPAATNRPNNSLSIQVTCSNISQLVGRTYSVVLANGSLGFDISISFTEADLAGRDRTRLQLGTLDTSNGIWITVPNSGSDLTRANAFSGSIDTDNEVFGIYFTGGGGGGSPPTPPGKPTAVPSTTACRIDITWSPSTDLDGDLQSYIVFRDGGDNLGTVPANTCIGTCSFPDVDNPTGNNRLLRFATHTYFIRATDEAEHSMDSVDSSPVQAPSSCPPF